MLDVIFVGIFKCIEVKRYKRIIIWFYFSGDKRPMLILSLPPHLPDME